MRRVRSCQTVVVVHGCRGRAKEILLGGRDLELKEKFFESFTRHGIAARKEGHNFPAFRSDNICNRGAGEKGVQFEFTTALRGSEAEGPVVKAIRETLLAIANPPLS